MKLHLPILGIASIMLACGGSGSDSSASETKTVDQAAVAYCACKKIEIQMEMDSEKGLSEEFLKCNEAYMKEYATLNANADSATAISYLVSMNCK